MNQYRKENRLSEFDYSQPGYYFITVCTENRKEYFGSIENGKIVLNNLGTTANEVWMRTPAKYQNIGLDE